MHVRHFALDTPNLRDHAAAVTSRVGRHSVLATSARVVVANAATTPSCGRLVKDSLQADYHMCKACESVSQTCAVLNIPQHTYEHLAATAAASTSQVSKCVRQVALKLESVIAFPEPSTRAATACETRINQCWGLGPRRSTALPRERTFQREIPVSLTTDGRCPQPASAFSRCTSPF